MRFSILTLRQAIFFASCLLLALGCGGGGSGDTQRPPTGAALRIKVRWPEVTRLIPVASKAIKIVATFEEGSYRWGRSVVVIRGENAEETVTVEDVPVGTIDIVATAHPNYEMRGKELFATGPAQAYGSVEVQALQDQTTSVPITMASTIDTIYVQPNPIQVQIGTSLRPTLRAISGDHEIKTFDSQYRWSTADPSIAKVDTDGIVTGVSQGETNLTILETESGTTITVPIAVTRMLGGVLVTPSSAAMGVSQTKLFVARAIDDQGNDLNIPATGFTWTSSNTSIATVNYRGEVTLQAKGMANIIATEKQSLKAGTAIVKASGGDLDVVIN